MDIIIVRPLRSSQRQRQLGGLWFCVFGNLAMTPSHQTVTSSRHTHDRDIIICFNTSFLCGCDASCVESLPRFCVESCFPPFYLPTSLSSFQPVSPSSPSVRPDLPASNNTKISPQALSIGSEKSIIPYDFRGTEPKKGYDIAVEPHFFVHQTMS